MKYCSIKCQKQYQKDQLRNDWYNNGNSPGWTGIKSILFEDRGRKCQVCGITEWNGKSLSLEVDHIDGDHSNNNPENLRIICPNCHSQTDTYKSRNIGKGRHYRRERYAAGQSY
jgi:5-methylcytosine-specific restriction endonuclease McrA